MSDPQDLLFMKFAAWKDETRRHTFMRRGPVALSENSASGYGSAYFDGASYFEVYYSPEDWTLGATPTENVMLSSEWLPAYPDNEFTIDCWIYPELGGLRYYPIMSSFSRYWWPMDSSGLVYSIGWSFQIDTDTGKLQMIGYCWGHPFGIYESNSSIVFDTWTHVAVQSWKAPVGHHSNKYFFVNGQPDGGYDLVSEYRAPSNLFSTRSDYLVWTNLFTHKAKYGTMGEDEYAPCYVGLGPRTGYTNPEDQPDIAFQIWATYKFKGYIDHLRVYSGPRFPVDGQSFSPPAGRSTTTTTTTTSTTSTTSTSTTTVSYDSEIPIVLSPDDRIILKLNKDLLDFSHRHKTTSHGSLQPSRTELGALSRYFDGNSYLSVSENLYDFSMGATLLPNTFNSYDPIAEEDAEFTVDFLMKPLPGPTRYLGICGAFSIWYFPVVEGVDPGIPDHGAEGKRRDYRVGWSMYFDQGTKKVCLVGYQFGQVYSIVGSSFTVEYDQWCHIAFMSWNSSSAKSKRFFKNGNPDTLISDTGMYWVNGLHRLSVGTSLHSFSPFTRRGRSEPLHNPRLTRR